MRDGKFVPLQQQDPTRWDREDLAAAEALLRTAAGERRPGRFQIEAAIQSAHASARLLGREDVGAVLELYAALLAFTPSIGAAVAHAAAAARVHGAEYALGLLDGIAAENGARVREYQAWWALRADLLGKVGKVGEAAEAYRRAIGLSQDEAVRGFLMGRLRGVKGGA